ncbi:MAG: acetyl-CoA hydrolase/transferase C-terminal domain-containing protein [Acidimicrobiales bacterium]
MPNIPVARDPADVAALVGDGSAIIVPIANGEPLSLMSALDARGNQVQGLTVHQMHALHDHPYLHAAYGDRLRHISYFLSNVTRPAFRAGTVDFMPANFSEIPLVLSRLAQPKVVLAATSLPDRHGYVSLGTSADYVSPFIGQVPFFIEANAQMPRTFGRNQLHLSQVAAWCVADRPLVEVEPKAPSASDLRIGALIAERIPNGATLQAGIGAVPNAVLSLLGNHRDLGIHTELLSDGAIDLIERGVVTGVHKRRQRGKVVTTFCLGTQRLYDFIHENPVIELAPVEYVNDPRIIGTEDCFVSINATTEVDLIGQCASETIAGEYWSGSGGQADFARGAMYSERGMAFVVLRSMTHDGMSRVVGRLSPGSVVTTNKNTVDHVVTEYGVAELRGRTLRERARALIAIADPSARDGLERAARELGYF